METGEATGRLLIIDQILGYLKTVQSGQILFYRCKDDQLVQLVKSEYENSITADASSSSSSSSSTEQEEVQQPAQHRFTYVYETTSKRKRADSAIKPSTATTASTTTASTTTATTTTAAATTNHIRRLPLTQSHLPPKHHLPYDALRFQAIILVQPFRDVTKDGSQVSLMCEMARLLAPNGRIFLVDTVATPPPTTTTTTTTTALPGVRSLTYVHQLCSSFFKTILLHPIEHTANQNPVPTTTTTSSTSTPVLFNRKYFMYIGTPLPSSLVVPSSVR